MSKKLRLWPKAQKAKKEHVYLEYGNPDACATIRLLPPSLDEQSFLSQAREHSEALKNGYREFNYQIGTRDFKLFEKPTFSVAHFEFSSVLQATEVREQLQLKIFHEPETEDNMSCQVLKPVLGMVYTNPVARKDVSVDHGSTFKTFCSLREETGKKVLLRSIIDELKAKKKKKKRKKAPKQSTDAADQKSEVESIHQDAASKRSTSKKKKSSKKKKTSAGTSSGVGGASGEAADNSAKVTETEPKKSKKKLNASAKIPKAQMVTKDNDTAKNASEAGHGAAGQAANLETQGTAKPKRKRNRKPKDSSKIESSTN